MRTTRAARLPRPGLDHPLTVEIEAVPLPQGRPRVRLIRRGPVTVPVVYDPPASRAWKQQVAWHLRAAAPDGPYSGPLAIDLTFMLAVTDDELIGWSKRPGQPPRRTGDLDNFAKAILDAAKGVLFEDDAQVVLLIVSKHAADIPSVAITCRPA